jgi:hypothetical protein
VAVVENANSLLPLEDFGRGAMSGLVRQALQSGRWSTHLDLWIYAKDGAKHGALRGIRRDCSNPRWI